MVGPINTDVLTLCRSLFQQAQAPQQPMTVLSWPSHTTEKSFMRVPVKAQIFGQTYTISGELDEDYVLKLASFVDEKMRAVANATATVDTQKVAVLAALAIADELHSAQRDLGYREDVLREQAERCLVLVERALKQSA
jgi:cell division protein ZapA